MFVPVYVWRIDSDTIAGECPLVPGVTFKGATPAELEEDVRGVWGSLKADAVENPLTVVAQFERAYAGRGGLWSHINIGGAEAEAQGKPVRVNLSLPAALVKHIDAAADIGGMTRSGWLAQAAREKLTRG